MSLGVLFDIEGLEKKLAIIEEKINGEDFWNDPAAAQMVLKDNKFIKDQLDDFIELENTCSEIEDLLELCAMEKDDTLGKEVESMIDSLAQRAEKIKLKKLLSGEYDSLNAIVSIHAGTGGLDAQDWAEMLLRMYIRYGEDAGFKVQILDMIRDTEAGIKTATLLINGIYAYGYLKAERGVHRIVRISPFDSSGKRHTSFASIDVMPEINEDIHVDINPGDLKIDTYRASGAGGQHVNTTDSAVRITHIPTGVVVACQNERSQHSNRATAMKMLTSKLIEIKEREQKESIDDLSGDYSQIAWGSQIRSYVFHPYNMVKDHRTGYEVGNVGGVMDGDIEGFIESYLVWKS